MPATSKYEGENSIHAKRWVPKSRIRLLTVCDGVHLSVPLDVLMRRKMIIELEAFILKCSSSVSTDIQTLGSVISRHGLHTKYRARRRFHDM